MAASSVTRSQYSPQCEVLLIDNAFATAKVSLFGGHVLQFCPKHDGRERLFLSSSARWDGSKSIRGGIPLCWPWFGAHANSGANLPAHGYARTRSWRVLSTHDSSTGTHLLLQLDACSGAGFDGSASLQVQIDIGATLAVTLITTNTGNTAFRLNAALHSYFSVPDIAATELRGLQGLYADNTRHWAHLPTPAPYRFSEKTDRIHFHAAPQLTLHAGSAVTTIHSTGHDSIVVWNPWHTGSSAFLDLQGDDYRHFVCVETALTQSFTLAAGQEQRLCQVIG
jgi:glucose-6-phosphate 1-epimerase